MKKTFSYLLIVLLVVGLCACNKKDKDTNKNDVSFDYKMIRETNKRYNKQNYMISPLSMAYALSMVNDGADGSTKEQITSLLGDYKLDSNINIKNKIGIANLIFISNTYKNDVSNDFISLLQTKHDSEVLFDDFYTPDAINDWVSKKTFNMINNAVDQISPDFVLGLANAIAIDVEWKDKFEENHTTELDFTKDDGTTMKTAMMHSSNDFAYIESKNAKGIVRDYAIYDKTTGEIVYEENENTIALEYIALLPNKNINDYIELLDKKELETLLNNKKESNGDLDLYLSLPKYTYDFSYNDFQDALITLGMKDAFNPDVASFNKMINTNSELRVYINKSIHKTHIELSENGTKAAAVTIFMFDKATAMPVEKQEIRIEFNKPFVYLIKEKNSDNIWFFGTVYEPMKWEDNKK